MNSTLKYALIFAGGMVAGIAAATAVSRGAINLKPLAAGIVSRGMDVKDAIANTFEKLKEDCQDLVAEARADQAQRRESSAE
ncbi:MAG: hypothetical protein Q4F72_12855 [Desulfovibrionaceae bacterium]|nr:hypothetical protein [Desulfovibrionaceae bacterium]